MYTVPFWFPMNAATYLPLSYLDPPLTTISFTSLQLCCWWPIVTHLTIFFNIIAPTKILDGPSSNLLSAISPTQMPPASPSRLPCTPLHKTPISMPRSSMKFLELTHLAHPELPGSRYAASPFSLVCKILRAPPTTAAGQRSAPSRFLPSLSPLSAEKRS